MKAIVTSLIQLLTPTVIRVAFHAVVWVLILWLLVGAATAGCPVAGVPATTYYSPAPQLLFIPGSYAQPSYQEFLTPRRQVFFTPSYAPLVPFAPFVPLSPYQPFGVSTTVRFLNGRTVVVFP